MRPGNNNSLEIVYGASRNRVQAEQFAAILSTHLTSGTVYLGYPVLMTAEQRVEVDALLLSPDHGLVAFLLGSSPPDSPAGWEEARESQDRLYKVLETTLGRHDSLRRGRQLAVTPATATVYPTVSPQAAEAMPDATDDSYFGDLDGVVDWVRGLPGIDAPLERAAQAALQHVMTIKPAKKRTAVSAEGSRGAVLKRIEREISNLDAWQKKAAIESPEGPQRIRGLAGSGKTVVIALKAAYWHTQNPDWNIAVTYYSRSLHQQIEGLISRFTLEHSYELPDTRQLHILPSWGSSSQRGMYSAIANHLGEPVRDFNYGSGKYGMGPAAFQGICQELLEVAEASDAEPIFDAVLIDEAQDLPPEFFQLVYLMTKAPKRIVWGYDEMQQLSEQDMPSTAELFGVDPHGAPLVTLDSAPGSPARDITLPVCYRNTPWALTSAHAIGLGIYRPEGLLQHPDNPSVWNETGYEVVSGALADGKHVALRRRKSSYPEYFSELIDPADAVVLKGFDDSVAQDEWIAQQIKRDLSEEELEHDDILIVLPDVLKAKTRAAAIRRALARHGIDSHLAGVNTSLDRVFADDSVAMAQIFRAKGNEAPMVYVVDAQYADGEFNAVTRRNTLFTAITRSRAWVRVTGWGPSAAAILDELEAVRERDFQLEFTVPTPTELRDLRHIHRDRSPDAEAARERAKDSLERFLAEFEGNDIALDDLPRELRDRLKGLEGR